MNSIVFTHYATPVGTCIIALALHRLGAWCDTELGTLEDLLDITGHEEAIDDIDDIEAVCALHDKAQATPGSVRHLLDAALVPLDRLLDRLWEIPLEDCVVGAPPSVFNVWVNWCLARLADIVATLEQALAA